jgi:2-(1,2-epoxy-1,2-dihydrophenyl)acetyl-CoA isomerase
MPTDELSTLRLTRDGAVLTIEINRPERLNALTAETADDLRVALRLAEEPEVRAVILTGAGRAFSSGADLRSPIGDPLPSGAPDFESALREHFNWPVRQIRQLPKPVIAAVNGPAVGIATSYALACDHVVAARSAYFLLSFVNVGLVPDGGASALIPARVGAGRFTQLAMLAERLPAPEAHAWGLVDDVVDDQELRASALALAQRLADGATEAQAQVKRMVNEGPLRHLEDALELEAQLQGTRGDAPEFREGVTAFLEKRAPRFADVG